jgi:type II secretory pathway pseudopilin PulG
MTLVEVLIAVGILAGVLVSVASLFVLGGQRVKSGRELTEATTTASDILESLNNSGYDQLITLFPSCTVNTGCTVRTDVDTYASSQWQAAISGSLYKGYGEIMLTPVGGTVTPPTFVSGEGLRLRVRILWTEGTNIRSVAVESLRF